MKREAAGPHYQVDYKVHLPADEPWRKNAENKNRKAIAHNPVDLWRVVCQDMMELLIEGDPNTALGLILELINNMPEELRVTLADSIQKGLGLVITKGKDQMIAAIIPKYAALPEKTAEGMTKRKSGLIVP